MDDIKKAIILLLEKASIAYSKEKKGVITRNYFREYLKENSEYTENDCIKIWGSFEELKKELKYDRNKINIIKKGEINKTYFISAVVQGADIDESFMASIESFCKHKNAELVLLTMRGVRLDHYYGYEIYNKYGEKFATEYRFNKNLIAKDFILNPQMIKPTTGLSRFGKKQFSIITASPKQFVKTIPTKKDSTAHVLYTTGTVCKPDYNNNRQGVMAEQDNTLGGLIVEVVDNSHFHIRNIEADKSGGFQDIDTYYKQGNKPIFIPADVVVCGDMHYGQEDEKAEKAMKELIELVKPKEIYLHDVFDGRSINPHEEDNMIKRLQRNENQKSLESELDYLVYKLEEITSEFPKSKINIVPSNHDDFIDRYLAKRRFVDDEANIVLACKLFVALAEGNNPIEYYLKGIKNKKIKNIKFLGLGESKEVHGIELNIHGHKSHSGLRGSASSIELAYGNSISAHTHSPEKYRDVMIVGCNCKLNQDYNIDSGSKWLHANAIIHKNGSKQLIITIDGSWRMGK